MEKIGNFLEIFWKFSGNFLEVFSKFPGNFFDPFAQIKKTNVFS